MKNKTEGGRETKECNNPLPWVTKWYSKPWLFTTSRPKWKVRLVWTTVSLKGQKRFACFVWSRGTGSRAGLGTLYTADRIILFLQLVLNCQCDFHVCMNMLQHAGFLSNRTAWENFGGAIYLLIVPKYNNKKENGFCTFGALLRTGTEDWDFQQVEQLASASVRII